jgi:hypothetical protein
MVSIHFTVDSFHNALTVQPLRPWSFIPFQVNELGLDEAVPGVLEFPILISIFAFEELLPPLGESVGGTESFGIVG